MMISGVNEVQIFSLAPTLNRDAGDQVSAIYQDVLSLDSQYKSRDKPSNSIT